MATGGDIRIGISGWTYAPWRSVFYPSGLPHSLELEYAARLCPPTPPPWQIGSVRHRSGA